MVKKISWALSWGVTTRSSIFDREGSLVMAWNLLIISGWSPDFFKDGGDSQFECLRD